jgi:hypothetical protein
MPPARPIRVRSPYGPTALSLPPPFRLVRLREAADAAVYACTHAAELRAGALISVGRFDVAEFAVVLEPDEAFAFAWRAFYAGMVALTDALLTVAPPEKQIAIEWPDVIRFDGQLVGGGRLAWPHGAVDGEPPPWLVFGAMIRTALPAADGSALRPFASRLNDEELGGDASDRLIESFARHLMGVIDRWREADFAVVSNAYVSRLAHLNGLRASVGDNGDLLLTRIGMPVERLSLHPLLAMPTWTDPENRGSPG